MRPLVAFGGAVAVATFLVRMVFPLLTFQVAHLNLWQWPQYVALFWLGTTAARGGWLDGVPERLRRTAGVAVVLGLAGLVVLVVAARSRFRQAPRRWRSGWAASSCHSRSEFSSSDARRSAAFCDQRSLVRRG